MHVGYQYNKHALEKLPVAEIPRLSNNKLSLFLVDQIFDAKHVPTPNTDISTLEDAIDKLVYALYDLTPDEIAIVEARE